MSGTRRPPRIGVIGSSVCGPEDLDAARAVGAAIARAGGVVVCGGLGGVMGAAAEGAAGEGGHVLGLLPGDDERAAHPGVSLPLPTGMGDGRNTLLVRAAEVVIAIAGEWGTLNEAAMCMVLGTPLVGLRDRLGDRFQIDRFEDPAAAVARALELIAGRRARDAERPPPRHEPGGGRRAGGAGRRAADVHRTTPEPGGREGG